MDSVILSCILWNQPPFEKAANDRFAPKEGETKKYNARKGAKNADG